jgi:hypothetical protein
LGVLLNGGEVCAAKTLGTVCEGKDALMGLAQPRITKQKLEALTRPGEEQALQEDAGELLLDLGGLTGGVGQDSIKGGVRQVRVGGQGKQDGSAMLGGGDGGK